MTFPCPQGILQGVLSESEDSDAALRGYFNGLQSIPVARGQGIDVVNAGNNSARAVKSFDRVPRRVVHRRVPSVGPHRSIAMLPAITALNLFDRSIFSGVALLLSWLHPWREKSRHRRISADCSGVL